MSLSVPEIAKQIENGTTFAFGIGTSPLVVIGFRKGEANASVWVTNGAKVVTLGDFRSTEKAAALVSFLDTHSDAVTAALKHHMGDGR